jgi:hypothetical protein
MSDKPEAPKKVVELPYWDSGLQIARAWYHEEWDGSYIQMCLARDIAQGIEREVAAAFVQAMEHKA